MMTTTLFLVSALLHGGVVTSQKTVLTSTGTPYKRPAAEYINITTTPQGASDAIPEAFVSYSIEFSSFPDFAGNKSSPNGFSDTLLENLKAIQGTKPHIRVGGNTQ